MRFIVIILFLCITGCKEQEKPAPNRFKNGTFKTELEGSDITSTAIRNDSLQLEVYNQKTDTFYIDWISNFEYVLHKKNPKTLLDSTPFHVKITEVKDNSYKFNAYFKGSKFIQKGIAFKLEE